MAALLVAGVGLRGLFALASDQLPESVSTGLQPAVLAFTALVGVVTATVFGVVPALSLLRRDTSSALKEDTARGSGSARMSLARASLVVAETALAVVLLVGAGLLLKSFVRLIRVDPGFSPDHVLTAKLSLPADRYKDADARRAFWQQLLENARQLPGVTAVGLVSTVPFSGPLSSGTYGVVGHVSAPTEKPPHARQDMVDGDYFRTMGIRLVEGRWFGPADVPNGPRVAVVDEFLAAQQFPRTTAIGRQLTFGSANNYTIIGVVRTISDADLAQPAAEGRIYLDAVQVPLSSMALVVRTALPRRTSSVLRARSFSASIRSRRFRMCGRWIEWVAQSLNGRRAPMAVLSLFGIVALVLSAIGTYGVVTFGVEQRVREFGIRQALGADRRSILSLVLTQGLRTTAAGALIGLAAAVAATHTLGSLLYGVGAFDWTVFGGATALLVAVAALASYVPAARATKTDPMVALRDV